MARKKERGDGDEWPRWNREGKIIGYRASYWVETASRPKGAPSPARTRARRVRP